jgi:hypothetical protein
LERFLSGKKGFGFFGNSTEKFSEVLDEREEAKRKINIINSKT